MSSIECKKASLREIFTAVHGVLRAGIASSKERGNRGDVYNIASQAALLTVSTKERLLDKARPYDEEMLAEPLIEILKKARLSIGNYDSFRLVGKPVMSGKRTICAEFGLSSDLLKHIDDILKRERVGTVRSPVKIPASGSFSMMKVSYLEPAKTKRRGRPAKAPVSSEYVPA